MGRSPGNWLASHIADLTLGKTAICIFVAKFYGRMPFLSPIQTLSAVQDLCLYPNHLGCALYCYSPYFQPIMAAILATVKVKIIRDFNTLGIVLIN